MPVGVPQLNRLSIDWHVRRRYNWADARAHLTNACPSDFLGRTGSIGTVTVALSGTRFRSGRARLRLHGARFSRVSAVAAAGAGRRSSNYRPELPEWVRSDTPRCILALGLTLPCTTDDILAAYRRKVKKLHPDRGGDRREFLRLQAHFEQAMALVAEK